MSFFDGGVKPVPILVSGDPRLRRRSEEVRSVDSALLREASGLVATLRDFKERNGFGRGISAVQVGIMKRLVALDLGAEPLVLINPEITWRSASTFMVWDDCLSVPDVLVRVRRHSSVSLTYRDHRFRLRHWSRLPPDLSELIQHEMDHLNGVLMTDLAEGQGAIQPLSRWVGLVGAARPTNRLSLGNIVEAATVIDPVFQNSPQYECEPLSRELGSCVTLKVETANPIRSFKGRGASYFVHKAIEAGRELKQGLVCASAGNFGQALAYACRAHGLPLTVFAAGNANPLKVERMRTFGAEVRLGGTDFDAAKTRGREWAQAEGREFVEDGREAWISEGGGTIGRELQALDEAFDTVLVPLGNGALLNGIALWMRAAAPATKIIGVAAAGAPAMERSWRTGGVVETEGVDTIADGVAVRVPVPEAVADLQNVRVDDVVLIDDAVTREAMTLIQRHAGLVVEPAGALGVAAILADRARYGDGRVATVLCGGNLSETSSASPAPGRGPFPSPA